MSDTTYRLDTMHSGLRLAALLVTLISAGLGILVIAPALARLLGMIDVWAVLFTLFGGSAIGVGAGWATERYLRGVWPSGRWLKVDEEAITLRERSGEVVQIRWAEPVDVLSWHFVIREGRRWIPKGWYCIACQLAQEGAAITPYAFMKPDDARRMAQWEAFPELISRKHPPNEHQRKQAEAQEHLRAAEKDRWNNGAEMTPVDFAALMSEINRRVTGWPGQVPVISSQ